MAVKAMGFLAVKETVTSSLRLEMPTRWPSGKWSCSGARCRVHGQAVLDLEVVVALVDHVEGGARSG